jgi:hypothetical protein
MMVVPPGIARVEGAGGKKQLPTIAKPMKDYDESVEDLETRSSGLLRKSTRQAQGSGIGLLPRNSTDIQGPRRKQALCLLHGRVLQFQRRGKASRVDGTAIVVSTCWTIRPD